MDTLPYTKREMDEKFIDIQVGFIEIKETLSDIKTQTQKTNGRVSALENWRWFMGGIACVITGLLVPILIAFIQSGKL